MAVSSNSSMQEREWSEKHLTPNVDTEYLLSTIRAIGTYPSQPKTYCQGQTSICVCNSERRKFADPVPVGLIGFLLSGTPLACQYMGWRGSSAEDASSGIGAYFFFGGLLMVLAGVASWVVADTFSCVVFASYGAFWLMYGATMQPSYGVGFHAIDAIATPEATPQTDPNFLNAYGFFNLWMGFMSLVYLLAALRTDITHCIIFLGLMMCFAFDVGADWQLANGNQALSTRLDVACGVWLFIATGASWYMLASCLAETLKFPFRIPLGDLSKVVPSSEDKV